MNKKSSDTGTAGTDRNSIIILTGRSSNSKIQLENQDLTQKALQNKIDNPIPPIKLSDIQHGQIIERKH